jgi:hypothetical protein
VVVELDPCSLSRERTLSILSLRRAEIAVLPAGIQGETPPTHDFGRGRLRRKQIGDSPRQIASGFAADRAPKGRRRALNAVSARCRPAQAA